MSPNTFPASRSTAVDLYFLEHRAKLIDIAAFLDRLDRAAGGSKGDDFRVKALRRAAAILTDGRPERARRVLELLSDPTMHLVDAAPMKGALGACDSTPS